MNIEIIDIECVLDHESCLHFWVFRKRRPTKTKTEDLRWVFVITKTKTHYENEDPSLFSYYENEDPSLFSYYENEDPKIFIYIVLAKISVKVSRN